MTRPLTLDERLAWVWSTIEALASLFNLSDEDLTYTIFESLDIDVRSALSEKNLKELAAVSVLSESMANELVAVGTVVGGLIDEAHVQNEFVPSTFRNSQDWNRIAQGCRMLLERHSVARNEAQPGTIPDPDSV